MRLTPKSRRNIICPAIAGRDASVANDYLYNR
jgi:hypothetical protein